MNFLALLPIFSTLIDRLFPDKEKADLAKVEMQKVLNEALAEQMKADASKMESQSKVIVAEAGSESYAARNWRPHLMYSLMLVIVYAFILTPILRSFGLDVIVYTIPTELWTLLSIGLGGYIGKDALNNYAAAKFNDKAYFDTARELFPDGMTQHQVDILNKAKDRATKG